MLDALNGGDNRDSFTSEDPSNINTEDIETIDLCSSKATRRIKIYDFQRPDRFRKADINTLLHLHEKLAPIWSALISRYFQKEMQIRVASVDQLTYEEFIGSIPNPTAMFITSGTLNSVAPQTPSIPLTPLIIEIDPAFDIEMFRCLFGGAAEEPAEKAQPFHELSTLEKSALRYISKPLLDIYSQIWNDYCGVTIESSDVTIESHTSFDSKIPPKEMVILVTCEAKFGSIEGMINICLPYPFLYPLQKLQLLKHYQDDSPPQVQYSKNTLHKTLIGDLSVVLQVEYFRQIVLYKDLKNLRPGNILYAPHSNQDGLCNLMVGNKVLFRGEIIADCTNRLNPYCKKIIRIVEKINPHKECDSMADRDCMEMEKTLANMKVLLAVEIGRTVTTVKELSKMREGTIVELDSLAGEPVTVFANNTLVARGEVMVIDENFGIRITELAEAPEDLPEGAADEGGAETAVVSAEEPSRGEDDNDAV
ncbi:FliM/FliN family flagellar motor switch protein [Treponema primitia]|uniref:FliM/FliN family flagellar motor switch protein n=1 Tax=Treponema primitia TaxID=88058 RepID=UPI00398101EB